MSRFIVHKSDGTSHVIIPSKKGLFNSDVKGNNAHLLISTVEKNEKINKQLISTQLSKKPVLYKTSLGILVLEILLNLQKATCYHLALSPRQTSYA